MALPVVRPEDRLLKLFLIRVRMGDIEGLELAASVFIDENEAQGRQNELTLTVQLAHVLDLQFEFDAFSVQYEVLICNTIRVTVGTLRWI